jgi:hypothetical protein
MFINGDFLLFSDCFLSMRESEDSRKSKTGVVVLNEYSLGIVGKP